MTKNEIRLKIDMALAEESMPIETRELLILLRDEIPKAKSKEDYAIIGLKWMELIVNIGAVATTLHQK